MRLRSRILTGIGALVLAVLCATPALARSTGEVTMYRLYNPYSGEHLYTASGNERNDLTGRGWRYEGIGWVAPSKSQTPVYRLYNPYTSDHHYTKDASEYNACGAQGWRQEGIGWYSADDDDPVRIPLYRQFNPYETIGTHNYTTSWDENQNLVSNGWRAEGIAWYAVGEGQPIAAPTNSGSGSGSAGSGSGSPSRSGGSGSQSGATSSNTVYITTSGKGRRYHSNPGCRGLSDAVGVTSISLQQAQALGLTPCRYCYH